jgi:hypothetical protein
MGSFSLWIEISISGFFYLLALIFFMLKVFGIKDITFIADIKDFVTLVSVGIAIASYLLGMLAHRLLSVVFLKPLNFISRTFSRNQLTNEKTDYTRHNANLVKVWQYGSERVHKELDFQFSLNSLMRSLIVGIPLSGISIAVWAWETKFQNFGVSILVLSFVLGIAFYVAYRRQRILFKNIEQAAIDEMKTASKVNR